MPTDVDIADTLSLPREGFPGLQNRQQVESTAVLETIQHAPGALLEMEEADERDFPVVLVSTKPGDATASFCLIHQIGEGGAGAVFLAQQTTLHRKVALKSPLEPRGGQTFDAQASDVRALLREARIMGYLEHPGIVPIHLVASDGQGKPFVVMKRIEGQTLEARLEGLTQAELLARLDAHLDVLNDISHALSYAHSRGVIHRDIKPANIMTGAFGEVYLLDWGIAVACRDDVPPTIPRAVPDQLVGTPAFMAPEMATLKTPCDPRTDVYLMGALLYFMLTGAPPHDGGDSPWASLFKAQQSDPKDFDPAVPAALGAICNKAMAREPAERFGSVVEFREAIEKFRARQAAQQLADRGVEQTAQLRGALDQEKVSETEVYAHFGAARQVLEEALRQWPGCAAARQARQNGLEWMVDFELTRDNPVGAQRLLEALAEPDEALARRVRAGVAQQRQRRQEIAQLRREMDPKVAGRTKAKFWFGIALAIAVPHLLPLAFGLKSSAGELVVSQLIVIALLAGLCVAFRARLFATRANKLLVSSVWLPVLMALLLRAGAYFGHGTIAYALAADLAFVGVLGVYLVINIDRQLRFAVPGYFLGALAAILMPAYAQWIFPITHFLSLTSLGVSHLLFYDSDSEIAGV